MQINIIAHHLAIFENKNDLTKYWRILSCLETNLPRPINGGRHPSFLETTAHSGNSSPLFMTKLFATFPLDYYLCRRGSKTQTVGFLKISLQIKCFLSVSRFIKVLKAIKIQIL